MERLARNRVYEMVRGEILSCALQPGAELREAELAERYGVSKSPIRDAMQKLEHEGLIDIEPRRGHRVRPISVRDAEDILELRIIMEVAAVKKIVEVSDEDELATLDDFRTADMTSVETFERYNRAFHHNLAVMSKNRRIAEEMRRVLELYHRLCIVSLSTLRLMQGGFEGALRDHVMVIDAIQQRDGNAAARVLRRHVEKSRGQIMRGLEMRPIVG